MRPALHATLVFICALLFFPPRAAAQSSSSAFGQLPIFEFHSGFWINLHHALYYEAKERAAQPPSTTAAKPPAPAASKPKIMRDSSTPLTRAEQSAWDSAVAYYAANYADRDLLFNHDLVVLKNVLEDLEDCDDLAGTHKKICDAGLPANLTQILDSAAPVYRAHLWPDHDRANRRWIARVAPLVEEQGVGISERLAFIYEAKWPTGKTRVDVSAFANWAGAYTTLDPLRVTIASTDPRNQGDEALEILFHEASHGLAEPVQSAITRECRQRGKPIPRDLWHALLFYTTGEVVKPLLSERSSERSGENSGEKPGAKSPPAQEAQGSGDAHANRPPAAASDSYVPYAIREGLYERGWNEYFQLLTRFWQPYLDGGATFDDAIARMVSSL
jgi:hypothetical protein